MSSEVRFQGPFGRKKAEAQEGDTLLAVSRQKGWPVPWGCSGGTCGNCTVVIEEGEANLSPPTHQEEEILLTRLEEGMRLACQARVQGPVFFRPERDPRP